LRTIGSVPLKNAKHEKYAVGVAQGLNYTQAYKTAGFLGKPVCGKLGLNHKEGMQERIEWWKKKYAEKAMEIHVQNLVVTRNDINMKFELIFELAIQGSPVIAKDGSIARVNVLDELGQPTGQTQELRRPDLSSANTAVMGLAKANGLLLDVAANAEDLDGLLDGMSRKDISSKIVAINEKIFPNRRKMAEAQAEKDAVIDVEVVEQEAEAVNYQ